VKELLPSRPVDSVVVEPWWIIQTGYIVEDDIKVEDINFSLFIKQYSDVVNIGPQRKLVSRKTVDYEIRTVYFECWSSSTLQIQSMIFLSHNRAVKNLQFLLLCRSVCHYF